MNWGRKSLMSLLPCLMILLSSCVREVEKPVYIHKNTCSVITFTPNASIEYTKAVGKVGPEGVLYDKPNAVNLITRIKEKEAHIEYLEKLLCDHNEAILKEKETEKKEAEKK